MSWISDNYEKAALGAASVLAIGLIYLGWSRYNSVETDFANGLSGTGSNETAVREADLVPKASQSLVRNRVWSREEANGREVDLFTGLPLFISRTNPEKAIDIGDPKSTPVHAAIPNSWWTENHIDPGFADAPSRDPDEDGFSNVEEFKGKTDPNSKKSHPHLVAKLTYIKDESVGWVIRPGYGADGGFPFKFEDTKRQENSTPGGEYIKPGELFFPEEPAMNRFKLIGSDVRKELNPRTNAENEITIVTIEDQRANKKGVRYEFPAPLQDDARKLRFLQYDRTAVLSLEALDQSGKEFRVEENTTFGLPQDAPDKNYLIKKITPDVITVEYPAADGSRKTVDVPKGGFATMSE